MGMFRLVERAFRFSFSFCSSRILRVTLALGSQSNEHLDACSNVYDCPLEPKLDLFARRVFKNIDETFGLQKSILRATYYATS